MDMFLIVYIYYYRSNLFGGLTLHLGLGLILMFRLVSRLCYLHNDYCQDFVQCLLYIVLEALFSSLGYKVLNVLAFFCKQHFHSS